MAKKKTRKSFKAILKSKWGGYIIIALVFIILLCIYPSNNLFTWISAKIEIHEQEEQMRKYQNGISDIQDKIKNLQENPDTLECFARENFHFTENGEDVYLLEE